MKAVFIHNVSDALATLGISVFILTHAYLLLKSRLKILMQCVPDDVDELKTLVLSLEHVEKFKHLYIWQMLEANVKIRVESLKEAEDLKNLIKSKLKESLGIEHTTLEIDFL